LREQALCPEELPHEALEVGDLVGHTRRLRLEAVVDLAQLLELLVNGVVLLFLLLAVACGSILVLQALALPTASRVCGLALAPLRRLPGMPGVPPQTTSRVPPSPPPVFEQRAPRRRSTLPLRRSSGMLGCGVATGSWTRPGGRRRLRGAPRRPLGSRRESSRRRTDGSRRRVRGSGSGTRPRLGRWPPAC
ncbi:unnamed protein product, partial [Ixodes hexagonus]